MSETHSLAVDQAVQNGDLAQEQADWMKTRGAGRVGGTGRGSQAAGQGRFANPNCPYYSQTNP